MAGAMDSAGVCLPHLLSDGGCNVAPFFTVAEMERAKITFRQSEIGHRIADLLGYCRSSTSGTRIDMPFRGIGCTSTDAAARLRPCHSSGSLQTRRGRICSARVGGERGQDHRWWQ